MTRETHERALRAAAQLTFLSAVGACSRAPSTATATASAPASARTDTVVPVDASLEASVKASVEAGASRPDNAACKAAIDAAGARLNIVCRPDWACGPDGNYVACCEEVAAKSAKNAIEASCCEPDRWFRNYDSAHPSCTPWGPPMPPPMRPRRERRAANV